MSAGKFRDEFGLNSFWADWEVAAVLKWYRYDRLNTKEIAYILNKSEYAIRRLLEKAVVVSRGTSRNG